MTGWFRKRTLDIVRDSYHRSDEETKTKTNLQTQPCYVTLRLGRCLKELGGEEPAKGQMEGPSGSFATEHLWLWLANESNRARDAKTSDGYYFHLSGLKWLACYSLSSLAAVAQTNKCIHTYTGKNAHTQTTKHPKQGQGRFPGEIAVNQTALRVWLWSASWGLKSTGRSDNENSSQKGSNTTVKTG